MSTLGRRAFGALILLLFVAGCGGGSTKKMAGLGYRANVVSQPRSVVLAPVARSNILGQSIPDRFLATITQPLAERGYYVMPVRLTTEIAIQEGFTPYLRKRTVEREKKTRFGGAMVTYGDSYLNFDSEDAASIKEIATELAAYFGADSVLFVQIEGWGSTVNTSEGFFSNMIDDKKDHAIDLDYLLTDAQGELLWRAKKSLVFTRGGGNWLKEMWNASRKPSDDEIDAALARDVNRVVIEGKRSKFEAQWFWPTSSMRPGPYFGGN